MWYVIDLHTHLEKFLLQYKGLSPAARGLVQEMVALRSESRAMHAHVTGMFAGYVFIQVDPKHIRAVHEALTDARIGAVLSTKGTRYFMPLSPPEVDWVHQIMQDAWTREGEPAVLAPGDPVRITDGPFDGMEGKVDSVAGPNIVVRVHLRRSVSLAHCTPDMIEVMT